MTRALVALVLCGSCVLARAADKSSAAAPAMTILRANCLSCHNDEKHKGGLRLTTREQALKGGEDGFVLVPGKPDDSLLAKLILPEADPHMPPKKQLADKDIATIRKWIASGMKWDAKVLAENPADARPVRLGAMPASYQPVLALALSPNEKQLAVGRANHVDIHDLTQTNRPVVARLEGHRDAVQSLAWSPEGQCLAAGGFRRVLLWDTQTLEQRYDLTNNLVGRVTALAFTPDGATLAASDGVPGRSGVIHLFSVTDGKNKTHWPAHGYSIYALRVSPD
ncbi:MAG TPA: c-type cytochrome domain-containing protein, partial [Verrucomicrobiae bacterium]